MTVSNSPVFEIGSWYQAFHQSHRLVAQNAQRHASDIGVNIYCMNIYIYISYYANIWNAIEGDWRRRRRWWCWWWWWWWMWPTFVCVESQAYVNMSASEYASPPDSLSLSLCTACQNTNIREPLAPWVSQTHPVMANVSCQVTCWKNPPFDQQIPAVWP
jgi:hypothetical protein